MISIFIYNKDAMHAVERSERSPQQETVDTELLTLLTNAFANYSRSIPTDPSQIDAIHAIANTYFKEPPKVAEPPSEQDLRLQQEFNCRQQIWYRTLTQFKSAVLFPPEAPNKPALNFFRRIYDSCNIVGKIQDTQQLLDRYRQLAGFYIDLAYNSPGFINQTPTYEEIIQADELFCQGFSEATFYLNSSKGYLPEQTRQDLYPTLESFRTIPYAVLQEFLRRNKTSELEEQALRQRFDAKSDYTFYQHNSPQTNLTDTQQTTLRAHAAINKFLVVKSN